MLCTNFEIFTDDSGLGFVHGFLFKIPVSQFALFQPTIQADASMFRYLIQVKNMTAVTSLTQLLALFLLMIMILMIIIIMNMVMVIIIIVIVINPILDNWVGVGGFSKVVATLNHVGGSCNLFMATAGVVWIIPSFRIWDYVLYVEHISRVITNCGQHYGPSHLFSQ